MARIEALNLELYEDNSDRIVTCIQHHPGDQEINSFLAEASIMVQIPHTATCCGLLIDHPEYVDATLYESLCDNEGTAQTDKNIIIMKPGQEVNVRSLIENKEIWFVFDNDENYIPSYSPQLAGSLH